ncbi:MAG TPA: hypothetical protein VFG42_03950 [Baekduia sp.]|uniref:hypothetical protein n=1 Tax=Baekduia sp. TaxID=2600305 RepID=UPI002D79C208|nr:hypothetical protein [Baekduia sp.]HET6505917.1 hypothetical protein [Baekduia sp.]
MRSITAATLTTALLGAVALGVGASEAVARPDLPQYVTADRVVTHDVTYRVAPNATQTFELPIAELAIPRAILVPCWGFDLTGPGIDLAAAGLRTYGWVAEPGVHRPYDRQTVLRADGWYLPESRAAVHLRERYAGARCRQIGWSRYVDARSGVASADEIRRARSHPHGMVLIRHPRRKGEVRPANRLDDGSVRVRLGGLRLLRRSRQMRLVVTLDAGRLAGPTTITLHARVLVRR